MTESNYSYENEFYSWLSMQVTSSQLSTLYQELLAINDLCISNQIISKSIFEVSDATTLQNIIKTTERTSLRGKFATAMKYYSTYMERFFPQNISDNQSVNQTEGTEASPVLELVKAAGISYVDRRHKGGCLWLIGGDELKPFIEKCRTLGVNFRHKMDGGQATAYREAWWTAGEIRNHDQENVLKEFCTGDNSIAASVPSLEPSKMVGEDVKENADQARQLRVRFISWMKEHKIKSGETLIIISTLKRLGQYANKSGSLHEDIFLVKFPEEILKIRRKSIKDPEFSKIRKQYRQLDTAIDLFSEFLKQQIMESHDKERREERTEVDELLKEELFAVLREELRKQNIVRVDELRTLKLWAFMNQYNLYSIAIRQVVLAKVRLLLNPPEIVDTSKLFRLHCGEMVYTGTTPANAFLHLCESLAQKYPLKIRALIGKKIEGRPEIAIQRTNYGVASLKMENPTAYIDSQMSQESVLYATKWLYKMCGESLAEIHLEAPAKNEIPNERPIAKPVEPPKVVDASTNPAEDNTCGPKDYDEVQLISQLEKIVVASDLDGITVGDLKKQLGCSMSAVRELVEKSSHVIEFKNRLIHEDAFIDWDDGAKQLENILKKLMQKNDGYVSSAQLYEYARAEMNMFLNDNDIDNERDVYDIAQHLFEKVKYNGTKFSFSGKQHISNESQGSGPIGSNFDICCKFAEDQGGVFKYTDLIEYLEGIEIKTGNLRTQLHVYDKPYFFYYEVGVLMLAKSMDINETWKKQVEHALGNLFADVGDHIILREIQPFWYDQLPDLPGGHSWTPLLLQSVLRFYGDELGGHTIIAMDGQGIDTLHTMLIRSDSNIQNFGDVVIAYLMENDIHERTFEAERLRMKLVEANIIQGNELLNNMPKALGDDERFAWDAYGDNVLIRV